MMAARDRLSRYLVAWEAIYSALRGPQVLPRPWSALQAARRATVDAWRLTAHGAVLRRPRDTDVIGPHAPRVADAGRERMTRDDSAAEIASLDLALGETEAAAVKALRERGRQLRRCLVLVALAHGQRIEDDARGTAYRLTIPHVLMIESDWTLEERSNPADNAREIVVYRTKKAAAAESGEAGGAGERR